MSLISIVDDKKEKKEAGGGKQISVNTLRSESVHKEERKHTAAS